jgi:hypothetical protein
METSVNWEDDSGVREFTLSDRGTAEHGAARLARTDIHSASRGAQLLPLLCERQPVPGNDHHGNIVFPKGTAKVIQVQLAGAMALRSHLVRRSKEH